MWGEGARLRGSAAVREGQHGGEEAGAGTAAAAAAAAAARLLRCRAAAGAHAHATPKHATHAYTQNMHKYCQHARAPTCGIIWCWAQARVAGQRQEKTCAGMVRRTPDITAAASQPQATTWPVTGRCRMRSTSAGICTLEERRCRVQAAAAAAASAASAARSPTSDWVREGAGEGEWADGERGEARGRPQEEEAAQEEGWVSGVSGASEDCWEEAAAAAASAATSLGEAAPRLHAASSPAMLCRAGAGCGALELLAAAAGGGGLAGADAGGGRPSAGACRGAPASLQPRDRAQARWAGQPPECSSRALAPPRACPPTAAALT